ncbi:AMP-binding protein [Streptomyces echinoruber]|uniref:Amino acid adenylation protein n=1 Tax=Streptomyces echinoruber TaxID=68898 RepID=A0A918V5H1_9ACTN|nr:AMP-binding protein [Streptomyces echinoruber]GGZ70782.1 amino acid adenylation protein [Streptomyces echinoruber]
MHDVVSAIAEQVGRRPAAPALRIGDQGFTYAELWARAGEVAGWLGPGPGRVGLRFAKDFPTYAAYLGILRAGGAVLPISTRWPQSRVTDILREAAPALVLVDGPSSGSSSRPSAGLGTAGGTRHQPLTDLIGAGARGGVGARVPDSPAAADEAYLLYTSGSTGKPKGVPVTHGALARYLTHVVELYELGPGCRMAQAADLTFDASVFEMLSAWASGATAVVAARRAWLSPVRFLREYGITHLDTVPSVITLARRTRSLTPGSLPELRWSMFGGEQLTYDAVSAWREAAPGSVIENNYGPTELTGVCANHRLPRDPADWVPTANGTVPIGRVYPHLESVVLGADGTAADEGELCVRGAQRFSGYVDPADNAGRFLRGGPPWTSVTGAPEPGDWYRTGDRVRQEHGLLVHRGRIDRQVKLRGYRVELDEVEAALRSHPAVREAAVLVADAQLVAVYVADGLPSADLRKHAATLLPDYMVPVTWRSMDSLPLNQNGKLDRAVLEGR